MRPFAILLCLAAALAAGPALAQMDNEPLRRSFIEAMQQLEAGNLAQAENVLREMLKSTDSARVKLELARTLFLRGEYKEAKVLFEEIMTRTDTPWRVRDNIAHFVRLIEERIGYLKLGITFVSDSNPRNLPAQKEFSIGNLQVTPTEAPKKMTGLRYSIQGWMPVTRPFRAAGYLTASYTDYDKHEFDRLTADFGVLRDLSDDGRVRGKAGFEFGTLGGQRLYQFPYLALDSVLVETETSRVAGEVKLGKVKVPDLDYLNATATNASVSWRKSLSQAAVVSLSGNMEHSDAKERPYSYLGWELGPSIDLFWANSLYLVGARTSLGSRKYKATDPLFGKRRSDSRYKVDVSIGNKRWRWQNHYFSLLASFERTNSNIGFYSYHKFNVSVVVE